MKSANPAENELKQVTIYTDGGCEPNPGPGGFGVVSIHGKRLKELSGGFRLTTNNRMEIYAAIAGLKSLKEPCSVKLYSDSRYLVDAVTKGWVKKWKGNGWQRNKQQEMAVNIDLWEELLKECEKHSVEFIWVKGHAGNKYNERCDELSSLARANPDLTEDEGYSERPKQPDERVTKEGQPCRKCETPVVRKIPTAKRKPGQNYYFEYYFMCPACRTIYFVEEAKRFIK